MQQELNFETASPINKERLKGQNRLVFDILESGEQLSILKAIKLGIFNLHSRISDLRNKHGVVIYSRRIRPNGIDCNEYSFTPFQSDKAA